VLALRQVSRVVTHRFGAEFSDRKIGRETFRDGANFGCLRQLSGKPQSTSQDEL
jgi:hypothetical protein